MSAEEDTELRDLVAQTLETNGVLNKIRAELRANVFLALEEQDILKKKTVSNKALKNFLETREGQLAFSVVREFLEYFNLDFTLAVLDPESDNANKASPRENLINELNMQTVDPKAPLLTEILRKKGEGRSSPPSPKLGSKIPQRIQSQKSPTDIKLKDSMEKRVVISPDDLDSDDDLLKELGVSPISYNHQNNTTNKKKPAWLSSPETSPHKTNEKNIKIFDNIPPSANLGSLKDAPPLPGLNKNKMSNELGRDVTSPEWDDLLKIDQKISDLGFEIPTNDNSQSHKSTKDKSSKKDSDYNYEDDFNASSSQKSDGLSITEEIEDDLSIGSFAGSKNEDLQTTDHTVSQMSDPSIDYGEEAEFY